MWRIDRFSFYHSRRFCLRNRGDGRARRDLSVYHCEGWDVGWLLLYNLYNVCVELMILPWMYVPFGADMFRCDDGCPAGTVAEITDLGTENYLYS